MVQLLIRLVLLVLVSSMRPKSNLQLLFDNASLALSKLYNGLVQYNSSPGATLRVLQAKMIVNSVNCSVRMYVRISDKDQESSLSFEE